jgi:hypothetical protein
MAVDSAREPVATRRVTRPLFARLVRLNGPRACVFVGLLAFSVSAALSAVRWPVPRVHDEFSYRLAADTFTRGRLSNPTHPLWAHFETFHVLQTPRYASKYPPVNGAFLAAGQVLTGQPVVGAWLAVALGSAGVCWMLQAWTRPRWALLGGVLTALHHGVHSGIDGWGSCYSWSQSLWGGGPTVLGGALVLGAFARLRRTPSRGAALALGVGLALLANSRPLEGLIVSVPAVVGVAAMAFRSRRWRVVVLPPLAAILAATLALMATYNRAVTGSPLRLPYSLYEAQYNPIPILTFGHGPRTTPVYRHVEFQRFFDGWCREQWSRQRTWSGWWRYHRERLAWARSFFVGPLALPLLMLPCTLRRRSNRLAAGVVAAVVILHLATVGLQPHYAAPAMGAFVLLVVEGMRRLAVIRVGGVKVGRALVALTMVLVLLKLGAVAQARYTSRPGWESERAAFEASLAAEGGRHLVVVRYGPGHDLLAEWVYNAADIDGAPVVWARETDAASMRRLFAYFHDRRAWLIEADAIPRRLVTYPGRP